MFGVDYSFSRPDINCLRERNVNYVVRYLSGSRSSKDLTPAEARLLQDAGIDIVTVWQTSAAFMVSDARTGRDMAKRARAQATQCGQPDNRPIYYALDIDPRSLTSNDWARVFEFLDGVNQIEHIMNIGIYGGYHAMGPVIANRYASFGWQTYAWSNNQLHPLANLFQFLNGQSYCFGEVDFNDSKQTDFGQWNYQPKEEKKEDKDVWHLVAYDDWKPGEPVFMTNFAEKVEIKHGSDHHELLRFFKVAAGESPNAIRIPRKALDEIKYT